MATETKSIPTNKFNVILSRFGVGLGIGIVIFFIVAIIFDFKPAADTCVPLPAHLQVLDDQYSANGYTARWQGCLIYTNEDFSRADIEFSKDENVITITKVYIPRHVPEEVQEVMFKKETYGNMVIMTYPFDLTGNAESNRVIQNGLTFLMLSPHEQRLIEASYLDHHPFNGHPQLWEPVLQDNGTIYLSCETLYAVYLMYEDGQIASENHIDMFEEIFGSNQTSESCIQNIQQWSNPQG